MISLEEAFEVATCCLRVGQPKRAEEIVQLTFSLSRSNPDSVALYSSALIAQGRKQEALPIFENMFRFNMVLRWHILQAAIALINARTYLEIGVAEGTNILRIIAPVV